MLLMCLIYLLRKYPVISISILLFLLPVSLVAQDRNLVYNILHNGDVKGTVRLSQQMEGNTLRIKIESLVQTRFLFKITVQTIEEAVFREGFLIFSKYYQKINDNEKHNWQLNWREGGYIFTGGQENQQTPPNPIRHTILSLYYQEPVNIGEVYSDNFQQNIPVIQVAPEKYKVILPNGNSNYFTYQKGILVRVDVNQSFYPVQFILKN